MAIETWHSWYPLTTWGPGPALAEGRPSAIVEPHGLMADLLHVFWRDVETHRVWTRTQNVDSGHWEEPTALPGDFQSSTPVAVTLGGNGRLYLFGTNSNHAICMDVRDNAGVWGGWQFVGDITTLYPVSATDLKGVLMVFAIHDTKIFINTAPARSPGGWSGWVEVPRGGTEPTAGWISVAAVGTRYGHAMVFATTDDQTLYVNKFDSKFAPNQPFAGDWLGWSKFPGDFKVLGEPCVSELVDTLYLFARNQADGKYYCNRGNARNGEPWQGWEVLSDVSGYTSPASAASLRARGPTTARPRFVYVLVTSSAHHIFLNRFGDQEAVPPEPPSDASLEALIGANPDVVRVTWHDSSTNEKGFYVCLAEHPPGVDLVQWAISPHPGTGWLNGVFPTEVPGTYTFEVLAYNGHGRSQAVRAGSIVVRGSTTEPTPELKEMNVWLEAQPQGPAGGIQPYVFKAYAYFKLLDITVLAGQLGVVEVKLVKAGYSTNDCSNTKAVVVLKPGNSTTPDNMQDLFGSEVPQFSPGNLIVACVSLTQPVDKIAIKLRYS